MQCPKVAIFDLDETLAESFQPPTASMMERFRRLMDILPVAIMTGAGFSRIEQHILAQLPQSSKRLFIFPNSGTQCFVFKDGAWQKEYDQSLSPDERARIKAVLAQASRELPLIRDTQSFGDQIADREAQIAFTVVGLDAPQDIKMKWDPDVKKRKIIREFLLEKLPEFDIRTGGASTVDITRKGINKAY